ADLKDIAGHLADALGDGPSVHRLDADDLEDEEIESPLDKVCGFAHGAVSLLLSVTERRVTLLRGGMQERSATWFQAASERTGGAPRPQQRLNFRPEPHGHGALRGMGGAAVWV